MICPMKHWRSNYGNWACEKSNCAWWVVDTQLGGGEIDVGCCIIHTLEHGWGGRYKRPEELVSYNREKVKA